MNLKVVALILFALMYVVMITMQRFRVHAALTVAIVFVLSGIATPVEALYSINWNVLMMIAGTMIVVHYFIESKMPNELADILLDKSKNLMWVIIYMALFAGFVSAFIDNVATVLMVAPVGLAICRKLNISPVPMVLTIAVSSNLQGAATLVGDTTSIMLGDYAKMDFLSFFWFRGRPGIFFAVELGALATIPIMMFLFREYKQPIQLTEKAKAKSVFPTVMLALVVLTLIAASFIKNKPDITNGLICMGYALVTIVVDIIKERDADNAYAAVRGLDWETMLLLIGLFVVIDGITEVGIIEDIAKIISNLGGGNLFLLYTIIVWGSVIVSAFVDNIPYVATMLPVVRGITAMMGIEPYLLYFGLLTGATLGGNLTPVGASANITAAGILRKNGESVTFVEFMKIGVPFTLAAVFAGYVFTWVFWSKTIF